GPITGAYFWWVLVSSPELLVFLFFMITDPKTIPESASGRRIYAVAVGLLATLLIAPQRTEFGAKVGLLGALALVCLAQPVLRRLVGSRTLPALPGRTLGPAVLGTSAVFAGIVLLAGIPARPEASALAAPVLDTTRLPQVVIEHSTGVATQLDRATA